MTIPTSSSYPDVFDSDENLYEVHDSLRMRLAEDYLPGDTSITVEGDFLNVARWPDNGLITLTEQCSDLEERAISFHYTAIDRTRLIISGLELLPGFPDVKKPKRITHVTVNVMAESHNNLKNALVAIQEFCGVKGTLDKEPFGPTLEGRINFLRKLVLQPKAWFTSDKRTGNVPLEIEFRDMSFRLGTDGTSQSVQITWDFGDHTDSTISITSVISADSVVPDTPIDVLVRDKDGGKIKKIYHQPGLYDVKLTVENDFGKDTVVLPNYVNARVKAPDLAIVRFIENTSNQQAISGVPPNGPFEVNPKIRSPINTLIQIEVETGENPSTPGISFAGEHLNELGQPIDPVTNFTWALSDDLSHPNSRETKASYSVGGIYDMKLRVDTKFGAFRITTYENSIDIVENQNLWHWIFNDSTNARAYEYGLISETFKLTTAPTVAVTRNDSFLNAEPNNTQQKREFKRNTGFAARSNIASGQGGAALLFWASGRGASDPTTSEQIKVVEFDGFLGTYINRTPVTRQWNWANLNSPQTAFFVFGTVPTSPPNLSPTNVTKQILDFNTLTVSSNVLTNDNYLNGAQELTENVAVYGSLGESLFGNFSVYRTAWKDNTGYILRNDGVGPFFRIKSFYRTEGTVGIPFVNIRKLQDIQGPTKLEGQLVEMSTAVFFLNNSGSVSKFTPEENIWRSGGPGVNSLLYRGLQDTTVIGFDDPANTLLAASDHDKRAYLSFDYSPDAFLRFNEIDLTFVNLGSRPEGEQWMMGVF
jgi:PKD repeat protein